MTTEEFYLTNMYISLAHCVGEGSESAKEANEVVQKMFTLMSKEQKYRWHDVSKNPDDLPNDGEDVIAYYGCYGIWTYRTYQDEPHWEDEDGYYHEVDSIYAWREIEPFEEN